MRKLRIMWATVVSITLTVEVVAANHVASTSNGRNLVNPASPIQARSWSSPLVPEVINTKRAPRRVIGIPFTEPRRYSAAAEWATRAALFALMATDKISGGSRDDTGDIGKRSLPPPDPYASPFGSFTGSVR
ncbi:hypothetical protein J2T07_002843 [Luteibacter jiangsuensis]|uniref:Secreted protein n=1 Tax=Luteibacter jiangsuensis TaxID=637577 RepID=A0ABT9T062_9GAMM|nr:hypothetical protein [Luteibacter jiangsuensis]MDQ0010637.1 hypothetical protein [Luteibacter jiangsuensis]